jgi:hypothetical protein
VRAPCGRSWLYAARHWSIRQRAAWTEAHSHRSRHPSRNTALRLSLCPFCQGLPGARKCVWTPALLSQLGTGFATNSAPLSRFTHPGVPRGAPRCGRTRTTAPAVIEPAHESATHARGCSARPVRPCSRRPSVVSSWTLSSLHTWWGRSARIGAVVLTPTGRRWRPFRTTCTPSRLRMWCPVSRLPCHGSAFRRVYTWR